MMKNISDSLLLFIYLIVIIVINGDLIEKLCKFKEINVKKFEKIKSTTF